MDQPTKLYHFLTATGESEYLSVEKLHFSQKLCEATGLWVTSSLEGDKIDYE